MTGAARSTSERAFTLIELLVVILIIGILLAIAAPSFLGQQTKAQDSAAEQALTVGYKETKAYWTNNQAFTTSAALASALQSGEPQNTWSAGTTCPTMPQVAVNVVNSNQAYLCTQATSGDNVSLTITPGRPPERSGVIGPAGTTYNNLVANPSFETGITHWIGTSMTASQDCTRSFSGNCSLRGVSTFTGGAVSLNLNPTGSDMLAVTPGTTYSLSEEIAGDSIYPGVQVEALVNWYDSSLSFISTSLGTNYTETGSWQQATLTAAAPAGAAYARPMCYFRNVTTGQGFNCDAVSFTATGAALPYFDGSTPGGSWTGTANNSASTSWSGTSW